MQVFTARVRDGANVPDEGVTLTEGTQVTVVADDDSLAFVTSEREERTLLSAIAEVERGEVVRAADLFERLRS